MTTAIMVKLGENEVKTTEDLAGCATDDLVGWTERSENETVQNAGYLDGLDTSRDEAESLIMNARVLVGWIDEIPAEEPAPEEAEAEQA